MIPIHSWNGSPSHGSARSADSPTSRPQVRPCLPQVEQLGDRVMLSAAPTFGDVGSQILVALLQGQVPIVADQLAALQAGGSLVGFADGSVMKYNKLTEEFLKLDSAIYGFGDVLIKGEGNVTPEGVPSLPAVQMINTELAKIETLASTFGSAGGNTLLPAVQKLADDTNDLVAQLTDLGSSGGSSDKYLQLTSIAQDFLKLDQSILGVAGKLDVGNTVDPGLLAQLKIEMSSITDGTSGLSDPSLQNTVLDLEGTTLGLLPGGII